MDAILSISKCQKCNKQNPLARFERHIVNSVRDRPLFVVELAVTSLVEKNKDDAGVLRTTSCSSHPKWPLATFRTVSHSQNEKMEYKWQQWRLFSKPYLFILNICWKWTREPLFHTLSTSFWIFLLCHNGSSRTCLVDYGLLWPLVLHFNGPFRATHTKSIAFLI